MIRTYSDLSKIDNFLDRYRYLKLDGFVGEETFGAKRYLNQILYKSPTWRKSRQIVLMRDNGFDLGIEDRLIGGKIYIHHMNPITLDDVLNDDPKVYDPEFLISTSFDTHNAIHYGDERLLYIDTPDRSPNDTSPWLGV